MYRLRFFGGPKDGFEMDLEGVLPLKQDFDAAGKPVEAAPLPGSHGRRKVHRYRRTVPSGNPVEFRYEGEADL